MITGVHDPTGGHEKNSKKMLLESLCRPYSTKLCYIVQKTVQPFTKLHNRLRQPGKRLDKMERTLRAIDPGTIPLLYLFLEKDGR